MKHAPYMHPAILQTMSIRLECAILGSVVDNVKPVETTGQTIDGQYSAGDITTGSATFNYDWGE